MQAFLAFALGLLAVLGMTSGAAAQGATFYTVTYVEAGPASAAPAAAAVRQYAEATRKSTGAVRVEALQRVDRPSQFVVLASWTDAKAHEAHLAGPATKEWEARLGPLLASPNDTRLHNALSVAGAAAPSPGGALYAVTHVDVIPPRKDDAVVALKELAEESRKDPGHVRLDVVQQTNRPNHFTVVEAWASRQAFDGHAVAPHTRRFRTQLAPMSGSLYDERLYQSMD
jgi:quinol monooxygenase YgiN